MADVSRSSGCLHCMGVSIWIWVSWQTRGTSVYRGQCCQWIFRHWYRPYVLRSLPGQNYISSCWQPKANCLEVCNFLVGFWCHIHNSFWTRSEDIPKTFTGIWIIQHASSMASQKSWRLICQVKHFLILQVKSKMPYCTLAQWKSVSSFAIIPCLS